MTKPLAINEIAARWLERRYSGVWAAPDQAELDAWLAKSSAHRAAYWRLEDAWENASRLSALRPTRRLRSSRLSGFSILSRTAAIVAICGVVGIAAYQFISTPQTRTYATDLGGRSSLKLGDGSRIDLNTNTSVRIATNGDRRTVWLDKGEAYFQIVHNAEHSFVVYANGHRITDLGTKFLVRQESGHLVVSLVEGRARVDADDELSDRFAVLTPGDVVTATADHLTVTPRQSSKLANELGWRQGQLIFSETPLGDAVAEFNRYNTTHLTVRDPAVAQLKINGTFPTDGAEMFARVAQHILRLRASKLGDDIVISR